VEQALQERAETIPHVLPAGPAVPVEKRLGPVEDLAVHDGRVLALEDLFPERGLAKVEDVREKV